MKLRTGFGFDVHQLKSGREFWLGGIHIPSEIGALGHSDADVLLHAICDALLGALALGDIGKHFPDTSSEYKNIDSKILLKKTIDLIRSEGYNVNNIDSSVCLEEPKIAKHIPEMQKIISEICQIEMNAVSIKATTNEKMGFIGRKEGITAYATVLLIG
jgi:2-C-methyl-D-erythritol 2,4-cyclodiphosphate synthase